MKINLEGLIPLGGGVYGLLVVYGKANIAKDAEKNELWKRKFGTMMKVLCPLLILFGLAELFRLL